MKTNTFVYKCDKDIKIEKLTADKFELLKQLQELSGPNIMKLKKQNELYKNKLNAILNQDTEPKVIDNSKFNAMLQENKKLHDELEQNKEKVIVAEKIKNEYETLKQEKDKKTISVLVNEKVKYLSDELQKYKHNLECNDKIDILTENNKKLKDTIKQMKDRKDNRNTMQIEKLLNDRKRNITDIIKKQKKIDRLLNFIADNGLTTKLVQY